MGIKQVISENKVLEEKWEVTSRLREIKVMVYKIRNNGFTKKRGRDLFYKLLETEQLEYTIGKSNRKEIVTFLMFGRYYFEKEGIENIFNDLIAGEINPVSYGYDNGKLGEMLEYIFSGKGEIKEAE